MQKSKKNTCLNSWISFVFDILLYWKKMFLNSLFFWKVDLKPMHSIQNHLYYLYTSVLEYFFVDHLQQFPNH